MIHFTTLALCLIGFLTGITAALLGKGIGICWAQLQEGDDTDIEYSLFMFFVGGVGLFIMFLVLLKRDLLAQEWMIVGTSGLIPILLTTLFSVVTKKQRR